MPEVADLLLMQQRLRACANLPQMGRFVVNESTRLCPYTTAALWSVGELSGKVEAVSGLPEPVTNTPFNDWIRQVCESLRERHADKGVVLDPDWLDDDQRERWQEFYPGDVVWIPLRYQSRLLGGLLLGRDETWQQEEIQILEYWSGAVAHAMSALGESSSVVSKLLSHIRGTRTFWVVVVSVIIIMFLPVSLTVNSSAEVVPQDALVVRAPLDGIVGEVSVVPNATVSRGDQILTFDDTSIRAQLDVVGQELAIARAELQRATQASVGDRSASSELPALQARVEQSEARVEYSRSLLNRTKLYSQSDGIVIIQPASELEGKPVQIGERLFTLAEPGKVELEFWLSVGDSIPIPDGAKVELFLNVYPDTAHTARIRYTSYQAEVSPEGVLGYRGRAVFEEPVALRVGWRGTAQIYGERVSLFYLVFRRPLSVFRQWTGL